MSRYLPDVNVWLALALSGHHHHRACREWFEPIDHARSVVMCRAAQQGLLRLLTNSTVLAAYGREPLTNAEAWDVMEAFLADDRIVFQAEPDGMEHTWRRFGATERASTKLWMDSYLAAFAVTTAATLTTTDTGFRQFSGLDLRLCAGTSSAH